MKLNLCTEQQEIVMRSLRATFDRPTTTPDECLNIVHAAQKMGLPSDWVIELWNDLLETYPQFKEEVLSFEN